MRTMECTQGHPHADRVLPRGLRCLLVCVWLIIIKSLFKSCEYFIVAR